MINKLISLVIIIFILTIVHSYSEEKFLLPKEKPSIFKKINKDQGKSFSTNLPQKKPLINQKEEQKKEVTQKKEGVVKTLFAGKLSEITYKFIHLLVVKGREKHLVEMVDSFMDQYNKEHHIVKATLTTAVPVEEKTVEDLRKLLLSNKETKGVEMQTKVDPEIVGGFVLQYGDMLLDHSVERKLQLIKKQIQDNTYISKI